MTTVCLKYLNEGDSLESMNSTLITLIPNINNVGRITDFRPINLCNVLYKIIAKSLANRLWLMVVEVISETQSAFVPGRLIIDNVMVGFECLYGLKLGKEKRAL